MDTNTSNKGCLNWVKGLGAALVGLLTAGASCAAIMQYIQSTGNTQTPASYSPSVIVVTSEPISTAQSNVSGVSPEEWQAIQGFLSDAVVAEISAYQYGDSSIATMFYGDALQSLQSQISDLNSRGVWMDAHFDYVNSYLHDIRIVEKHIEVDSCEYWSNDYYNRQTGELLGSDPSKLVPQTITIELLDKTFYITSIAFYTGQAFCQ